MLAKHWPNVKRYEDVTTLDFNKLEKVDLICGGFPCQPVSTAGKKLGVEDERWLWPEFGRAVREIRPRYVLVENPPGILNRGMSRVLGDLAALDYCIEGDCIPAAVFGAPHLRYRVFLVAYPNVLRCERRERRGAESKWRVSEPVISQGGEAVPDFNEIRRNGWAWVFGTNGRPELTNGNKWPAEPNVGRMVYGVPARVDRIAALGNAVVPQVAEFIGNQILEFDKKEIGG